MMKTTGITGITGHQIKHCNAKSAKKMDLKHCKLLKKKKETLTFFTSEST